MTFVKICGVVSVEDALMAVDAGADAVGLNFVQSSKRRIDLETGAEIRRAVGDRAEVVAVVADASLAELQALRERTGIRWLQLHGGETPELLTSLLPQAYKAVAIAGPADVVRAQSYGGERLLVDAKVEGELGGTGRTFDWTLVADLAAERPLLLAGGLTPDNVAEAVTRVRPWGVDVASGVETAPRIKSEERVRAFVAAVRRASAGANA